MRFNPTWMVLAAAGLVAGCNTTLGAAGLGPMAEVCTEPYVQAPAIQGRGDATPLAGQQVTTQGVVTADFEGAAPALRGFYLQDLHGDGDAATSDAVFVFNRDNDDVAVGDVVRVTGRAEEFGGQTQVSATAVLRCGTTAELAPVRLALPFGSPVELERHEGMLVTVPETLHVTEHYQLGRYGEVLLSAGGRLPQPTSVAAPGPAARAVAQANALNRILLDDASFAQNPDPIPFGRAGAPLSAANTLRGGDEVRGLVGVLTHTAPAGGASGAAWRIRPAGRAPRFHAANPRLPVPVQPGGNVRVASFNVLNYFNTFENCTAGAGGAPTDCRGAESAAEFARQWPKTVAAIVAMNPDVLGVIEIENDGYGDGSAIAHLVGRLNAATQPGRYAFLDVDQRTGRTNALGTDAIKVGFIYQPAAVTPAGRTAVLDTREFTHGGDGEPRTRPSLVQAFQRPDGARVLVSVNHWKSKGSPCDAPAADDGQGNCNEVRTRAARELVRWLATDPTGTGEPDVLLIGDLNSYAMEDPVRVLREAGFADLLRQFGGERAYSYVFAGQWGYLDHALASASLLSQVRGATAWHINADEPPVLDYNLNFRSPTQQQSLYAADPYRSADHDPVLVGLDLRR